MDGGLQITKGCAMDEASGGSNGTGEKQPRPFDAALCLGSSSYWAAVILMFLFPVQTSATSDIVGKFLGYLLLAAFTGIGFAIPKIYSTERGRRTVASAVLIDLALLSLQSLGVLALPAAASLALRMFAIAYPMVEWGFAFASLDKREASRSVGLSALVSDALVLVAIVLSKVLLGQSILLAFIYLAFSCVALLSGHVELANRHRVRIPARKGGSAAGFVFSRIVLGVLLGASAVAPQVLSERDASLGLAAVGLAVTAIALVLFWQGKGRPYAVHPVLVVMAIAMVYIPFFEHGLGSVEGSCAALVWMAWAMMSSVQLSDVKERLGLSELRLCLIDKTVLSLSIAAGVIAFAPLMSMQALASLQYPLLETALLAALLITVLYVSVTVAGLVEARREDEVKERVTQARKARLDSLYGQIAQEYGLTAREREVMEMLAEGYTRTHIRKELNVSDGTAKAHIAHIYSKIGIHHKDDLLKLIDERTSEA
jgi:DNA-binding CsgD family transcriptional regulator